jgi:hypothetical protein
VVPRAVRHFEALRDLGKLLLSPIEEVRSILVGPHTSSLQHIMTHEDIDTFLTKRPDYRRIHRALRDEKCTIM